MKLYIAEALVEDGMASWADDPDPVEFQQFLGAFDALEGAQAAAERNANHNRADENDLIGDAETGEAEMPEVRLRWTGPHEHEHLGAHWLSDAVGFAYRDLTIRWRVTESTLNPAR